MKLSQFPVYTVSQVNNYLKDLLDNDPFVSGLLIRGEISNYKCYPSGHHYFSLKDEKGSLRCVMFRGDAMRLKFRPANGMSVVAFGRITVFPRDGQYQLYCSELFDDGRGALDQAFEKLRLRLEQEGLFDPAAKQSLPKYPGKIALVTSSAGAAVRDMIRVLGARWPLSEVLVVPVRVQGEGAAEEISAAIHEVNNRADIDLIITGRGGGSREDLWAFNEEVVARAIYISNIPVISAVGHEPDVSISDYVADVRAATPSNGAELAVPDRADELRRLKQLESRMAVAVQSRLASGRKDLTRLENSRVLRSMKAPIEDRRMLLDAFGRRMAAAMTGKVAAGSVRLDRFRRDMTASMKGCIRDSRAALAAGAAGLEAMSPLKVLGRGYAIARQESGIVISVGQIDQQQPLDVTVSDGVIHCEIKGKEAKTWQ